MAETITLQRINSKGKYVKTLKKAATLSWDTELDHLTYWMKQVELIIIRTIKLISSRQILE